MIQEFDDGVFPAVRLPGSQKHGQLQADETRPDEHEPANFASRFVMDSSVTRSATTCGRAHLTMNSLSSRTTVTSISGISFLASMATGPPTPPQPMMTSYSPCNITSVFIENRG